MKTAKKQNGHQPPRPLEEMTPFGRRLYELAQRAAASTKKRMTIDEINRRLAERRGGVVR